MQMAMAPDGNGGVYAGKCLEVNVSVESGLSNSPKLARLSNNHMFKYHR